MVAWPQDEETLSVEASASVNQKGCRHCLVVAGPLGQKQLLLETKRLMKNQPKLLRTHKRTTVKALGDKPRRDAAVGGICCREVAVVNVGFDAIHQEFLDLIHVISIIEQFSLYLIICYKNYYLNSSDLFSKSIHFFDCQIVYGSPVKFN